MKMTMKFRFILSRFGLLAAFLPIFVIMEGFSKKFLLYNQIYVKYLILVYNIIIILLFSVSYYRTMNSMTSRFLSIAAIVPVVLLFASLSIVGNQQAMAFVCHYGHYYHHYRYYHPYYHGHYISAY
jgi:hypothetical protein